MTVEQGQWSTKSAVNEAGERVCLRCGHLVMEHGAVGERNCPGEYSCTKCECFRDGLDFQFDKVRHCKWPY